MSKTRVKINLEEIENLQRWSKPFEQLGASAKDNWKIITKCGNILKGSNFRLSSTDGKGSITLQNNEKVSVYLRDIKEIHWLG